MKVPSRSMWVGAIATLSSLLVACASSAGSVPPSSTTAAPTPTMITASSAPSIPGATKAPASTALASIPEALRYRWIDEPRQVPVIGMSTRTGLNFDASTFTLTGTQYGFDGILRSTAGLTADGRLALVSIGAEAGCQAGDAGTYAWSLSPGATVLTISPGSDPCAARAAVMPGTWMRIACKNTESGCLGDVEAGLHKSQYIDPLLPVGVTWEPRLGAITYVTPAGWANAEDFPRVLRLTPSADYALEGPDGPMGYHYNEMDLFPDAAAVTDVSVCSTGTASQKPQTIDELIAFIRSQNGLASSKPTSLEVGGHPARMVDVHLAPSWKHTCPDAPNGLAGLTLFADAHDRKDPWLVGVLAHERERFIVVDLGSGSPLLIVIDSSDPATYEQLVSAAMPIVTSLQFK